MAKIRRMVVAPSILDASMSPARHVLQAGIVDEHGHRFHPGKADEEHCPKRNLRIGQPCMLVLFEPDSGQKCIENAERFWRHDEAPDERVDNAGNHQRQDQQKT